MLAQCLLVWLATQCACVQSIVFADDTSSDWSRQWFGGWQMAVNHAHSTSSGSSDLVWVLGSPQSRSFGAIDSRTGTVQWRVTLPHTVEDLQLQLSPDGAVETLGLERVPASTVMLTVHWARWNASTGRLVDQQTLPVPISIKDDLPGISLPKPAFQRATLMGTAGDNLFQLMGAAVCRIGDTAGHQPAIRWCWSPEVRVQHEVATVESMHVQASKVLVAVWRRSPTESSVLDWNELDVETGKLLKASIASTPSVLKLVLCGDFVVFVDSTGSLFVVDWNRAPSVDPIRHSLSGITMGPNASLACNLGPHGDVGILLRPAGSSPGSLIQYRPKSRSFTEAQRLPDLSELWFWTMDGQVEWMEQLSASVTLHPSGLSISYPAGIATQVPVQKVFSLGSSRFAIVLADGNVFAAGGKKVDWVRFEALMNPTTSQWVELPASSNLKKVFVAQPSISVLAVFLRRWVFRLEQVQEMLGALLLTHPSDSKVERRLISDKFGLRKLLVLGTATGSLSAVLTDSGDVVWSRYEVDWVPRHIWLVRQAESGLHPILAVQWLSAKGREKMVWLNALTGETVIKAVQSSAGNSTFPFIFITTAADSKTGMNLLGRYDGQQMQLLPPGNQDISQELIGLDVVYHVSKESNTIAGCALRLKEVPYMLSCVYSFETGMASVYLSGISSLVLKESLRLHLVPNMVRTSQFIEGRLQIVDVTASLGRVLGDRTVFYKYLNPNMLAVGTFQPILGSKGKSLLTVYLIDRASGRILYTQKHENAHDDGGDNVQIVMAENWIVYSYWSWSSRVRQTFDFALQPTVTVIELYESEEPDSRMNSGTIDAFSSGKPYVISQSFFMTSPVLALSVTTTKSGITAKEVLVSCVDGQVVAFSRRLLDPRRPLKPASSLSTEDKEEMLIPYAPILEENPKEVVTHEHAVRDLTTIRTAPTHFESTTLVCAYGRDLFCTKKMPSKSFDILGPEFSRTGLVAVLVGLLGATIVCRQLSLSKKLRQEWR